MPELVIDFTEEVSFEPIRPGWYQCTITESKPGTSSTGNPKLDITLEVVGPDEAGTKLFDSLPITGKGTFKIHQVCDALFGESEDKRRRLRSEDFIGGELEARVVNEVWREEAGGDGRVRNKPAAYRALSYEDDEELDSMFTEASEGPEF